MFFSNSPGSVKSSLKMLVPFGWSTSTIKWWWTILLNKMVDFQGRTCPGSIFVFSNFLEPKTRSFWRPKTWPLVLSQWPKTLRFWRTKTKKRRMKIKVKGICVFLDLCESPSQHYPLQAFYFIIFCKFLIHTSQFNPLQFCHFLQQNSPAKSTDSFHPIFAPTHHVTGPHPTLVLPYMARRKSIPWPDKISASVQGVEVPNQLSRLEVGNLHSLKLNSKLAPEHRPKLPLSRKREFVFLSHPFLGNVDISRTLSTIITRFQKHPR